MLFTGYNIFYMQDIENISSMYRMFLVLRWPLTLCCLATQSRLLPCLLSVYSLMEGSWIDGIADEVTASQWRRLCSLYTYKKCISICHQVNSLLVPRNAFYGLYISREINQFVYFKIQVSRKWAIRTFNINIGPLPKDCSSIL